VIELEFDNAFQARHLAVPMSQAYSVAPRDDAADAAARLSEQRFDQAPVVDSHRILGFVLTNHLQRGRRVADAMTPLGSGNVVSGDASIGRLMEWILDPGFLFVLEGRDVTGFISVSDFIKQPVRGYLYLLLARLEIGLAGLARRRFLEQEEARALLTREAKRAVLKRYTGDREAGKETELLAYFGFPDLIRVFTVDDELRRIVGDMSRDDWIAAVDGFVGLRNDVMHPIRNVDLAKDGLIRLQASEQRIRVLIEKVETAINEFEP
jgi:CBS domain-containing protein